MRKQTIKNSPNKELLENVIIKLRSIPLIRIVINLSLSNTKDF